jgi:hypothetical protein
MSFLNIFQQCADWSHFAGPEAWHTGCRRFDSLLFAVQGRAGIPDVGFRFDGWPGRQPVRDAALLVSGNPALLSAGGAPTSERTKGARRLAVEFTATVNAYGHGSILKATAVDFGMRAGMLLPEFRHFPVAEFEFIIVEFHGFWFVCNAAAS